MKRLGGALVRCLAAPHAEAAHRLEERQADRDAARAAQHRAPAEPEGPRVSTHQATSRGLRDLPVAERVGARERDEQVADLEAAGRELALDRAQAAGVGAGLAAPVAVAEPARGDAGADLVTRRQLGSPARRTPWNGPGDVAVLDLTAVVDRLAVLQRAEGAGAVEVLEAEADRIHQVVAGGARGIDRVLGEALARGQRRAQLGRLDHEVRRAAAAAACTAAARARTCRGGPARSDWPWRAGSSSPPCASTPARCVPVERRLHERAAADAGHPVVLRERPVHERERRGQDRLVADHPAAPSQTT